MYVYLDIESNGLLDTVTEINCLRWHWCDENGNPSGEMMRFSPHPENKFVMKRDFHWTAKVWEEAEGFIGHNIIAFDSIVMHKILGYRLHGGIIDTLLLSKLSQPDRFPGHSLEDWGNKLGNKKIKYEDWCAANGVSNPWDGYRPEMGTYCEQDVLLGMHVLRELRQEMKGWDWGHSIRMEHQFAKDFAVQGLRGVKVDVELARQLVSDIDKEMAEIEAEVEPLIPPAPGTKAQLDDVTPPKQQFKKDGTPTAHCTKWFDDLVESEDGWWGEKLGYWWKLPLPNEPLATEFPAKLSNQEHLKGWLMDQGWEPTMWSYKKEKDKNGKLRVARGDDGQPIPTQPKFHDKGELCSGLEAINTEFPHVKKCVRWIIIRHRRGLLQSILDNLRPDGCVGATGMSLGTPTSRVTHRVVANIPKAEPEVVLGKECRSIFIARGVMAGVDASGLELRCLAHRVGSSALRDIVCNGTKEDGTEIHSVLLKACGELVPSRTIQKNVTYGWLYGASDEKLGITAGHPKAKAKAAGEEIRHRLIHAIPGLPELMEKIEVAAKRGYVRALDGRKIPIRSKHATLNTLLQSDGSILVKTAQCYMNKKIKELKLPAMQVISYHDEVQLDCKNETVAQAAGQLFIDGLRYAGKLYGFNCPLDGEVKIGKSWADTH